MQREEYLEAVRADGERLTVVARGPLDGPVPSCPDWTVRQLVRHTGYVHRWAAEIVRSRATEPVNWKTLGPAADDDGLADWFAVGVSQLVDVLATTPPDEPAWNWSTHRHRVAFWPRRMALETAVHRWDGEAAGTGSTAPSGTAPADLPTHLAVDGIAEVLDTWVPAGLAGGASDITSLGGTLHLHCTDAEGEWVVRVEDGQVDVRNEHAKGDAAVRGPASDLYLALWGRGEDGAVEVFGDVELLHRLRAIANR